MYTPSFRNFVLYTSLSGLMVAALLGDRLSLSLSDVLKLWRNGLELWQGENGFNATAIKSNCEAIATAVSSTSSVYYPGSPEYDKGISHWISSSTEESVCSVEPGTTQDVQTTLRILGSTRTPFAVKGGGRSPHRGFSSTPGIHIAMSKFSSMSYHETNKTVDIGAGLAWDDVYGFLQPYGVSVAGGRVSGVGVAGFLLGGGLSWKTNQVGLAIDTVEAYEIVLPTGVIQTVTATSNEDLFFALKGGMNNFGIVTKFTIRTFPQTDIWGGVVTVQEAEVDAVNAAVSDYEEHVSDPKAALNVEYIHYMGTLIVRVLVFYDAPTPPTGIFEPFFAIPNAHVDVNTTDFVAFNTQGLPATGGNRVTFGVAPVEKFSTAVLQAVANETLFWGRALAPAFVMNIVEVFLPSYFSHGAASAYPPDRSYFDQPINTYVAWDDPQHDDRVRAAVNVLNNRLQEVAAADGQNVANAACYPNIAAANTPLARMYGNNIGRLRKIKREYDPEDIMGLAGGYKL